MDNVADQALDPRRREAHPERIRIAGETFVRNDVQARELGCSERSVNRGDKHCAPFLFIGGIKYRPEQRYAAFLMSGIQVRKPPPSKQSQKKIRNQIGGPARG